MAKRRCDGCDAKVKIAGGIGDLWSFDWGPTGGMTLVLKDGSEHFLCLDCVDRLPDERAPTAEDVEAIDPDAEGDPDAENAR